MKAAYDVIRNVFADFAKISGRSYDLVEKYMLDDAERAIVIIGSSAGTAKEAVNRLRAQGEKVGLLKIRVFRPFPAEDIAKVLMGIKSVAVMDKADSFNAQTGPVYAETCAALYGKENAPKMNNYIYGLGGRDVSVETIYEVFDELKKINETGEVGETYRHIGVRGL